MELTKKSKVVGIMLLGMEEFYALDKPFHMCDDEGNPIEGWVWKCVSSSPINLDVLEADLNMPPLYDEPVVIMNGALLFNMKGIPKEVEYLNPDYKFELDDEGEEPTEEEKELMDEMTRQLTMMPDTIK